MTCRGFHLLRSGFWMSESSHFSLQYNNNRLQKIIFWLICWFTEKLYIPLLFEALARIIKSEKWTKNNGSFDKQMRKINLGADVFKSFSTPRRLPLLDGMEYSELRNTTGTQIFADERRNLVLEMRSLTVLGPNSFKSYDTIFENTKMFNGAPLSITR